MQAAPLASALCLAMLACAADHEAGGSSHASAGGAAGSAGAGGVAGAGSAGAGGAAGSGGAGAGEQTNIRVHYLTDPQHQIKLRGSGAGLSWDVSSALTQPERGVWELRLKDLASAVEYKPVLEDAAGELVWPLGASLSNWRILPGQTQEIYPFYDFERGSLEGFQVAHPRGLRDVEVYLPPSYHEPGAAAKRYPVLVLQDGQNLFDQSALFGGWRLDSSLDALFARGQLLTSDHSDVAWQGGATQELIVVGVSNSAERVVEYTPTNASVLDCDATTDTCGGGGAEYLSFIIDSLLPALRQRYRTQGARAGFGGSSLGGLLTLQACFTRSQSFDRCLALSPSLWWDDEWALRALPTATPANPIALYLDAGTQSDGLDLVRQLNSALLGANFSAANHLWCLEGAGMAHNELAWAARAPWAVYFAYQDPQRVQAPVALPPDLSRCE